MFNFTLAFCFGLNILVAGNNSKNKAFYLFQIEEQRSLLFQTFPFFGVEPTILNEHGEELEGEAEGYLVNLFDVVV